MKATRTILAAMVLGSVIGASQANAQCSGNAGTCTSTNTASVSVGVLVKLGMTTSSTTLTSPTADQIAAATPTNIDDAGPSFTIKANRSWTLKIKSGVAGNWTYVGSDAGVKPISDLLWATSSGGTYAAISATDATFTSGAGASNGVAAQAFFRTSWLNDFTSASNAPGTYSLPVVFTLTAP